MGNDLISIIVPVYQVEQYLKKCVDSILNQDYSNIEVILVDDGSKDNCPSICDNYAHQDSRVKVIHKANGGLSDARNVGIKASKGSYIAFVDSDDWIEADYISAMYRVMQDENCDIVQCGYVDVVDENYEEKESVTYGVHRYTAKEFAYASYTLMYWQCQLAWNKLYKKELFADIEYPVGRLHEDEATIYKVVWNANKIAVISSRKYYYRHRPGSITSTDARERRLRDSRLAFQERKAFYAENKEEGLVNLTEAYYQNWEKEQLPREERELLFPYKYFVFPFPCVPKNSNIILYGAGDVGRQFYRQVRELDYCNIIMWVDKNITSAREKGFPVVSVENLKDKKENNKIVIAINNKSVALQVIKELTQDYGISREDIIYQIKKV